MTHDHLTEADLPAARAYVRKRWTTRHKMEVACHVLANFGDWQDRILARQLRNQMWSDAHSEVPATGMEAIGNRAAIALMVAAVVMLGAMFLNVITELPTVQEQSVEGK